MRIAKCPIIDVGRSALVPGFVNAHTHLAMAPLRGIATRETRQRNVVSDVFFALESHLRPEDVRAFTRLGAVESLLCGVTEVWDHYYYGEEVAHALVEAGLGGTVAPTLQDLSGPGATRWEAELAATATISRNAHFRSHGVSAAYGPHATDTVSSSLLRKVGEAARRAGAWVHLHAAQNADEMRSDSGPQRIGQRLLDELSDARVLMAHGLFLNETECRALARARVVLAYCPLSQLQFGFLAPLASYRRNGGSWVLGTDCVASNDALDVQRELPLVAANGTLSASFGQERAAVLRGEAGAVQRLETVRKRDCESEAIEPEELLCGAYGVPLYNAGADRNGEAGRNLLTVGARADFLVLDPDDPHLFPLADLPRILAYGSTARAISWMCVSGRLLGQRSGLRHELLNGDSYQEWLREALVRREELFQRAKMRTARSFD
jgi:5-methylthioadenosine/S-adenosylhomocysteine deaminase